MPGARCRCWYFSIKVSRNGITALAGRAKAGAARATNSTSDILIAAEDGAGRDQIAGLTGIPIITEKAAAGLSSDGSTRCALWPAKPRRMTINWCGRSFRFWMVGAPPPNLASVHFFLLDLRARVYGGAGPAQSPELCGAGALPRRRTDRGYHILLAMTVTVR